MQRNRWPSRLRSVFGVAFLGEHVGDPIRSRSRLNAFFAACFGALSHLFTRVEIVRVRRKSRARARRAERKGEGRYAALPSGRAFVRRGP